MRKTWPRRLCSVLVTAALIAGTTAAAATAAEPPPTVPPPSPPPAPKQLEDVLLASYLRTVDRDPRFIRHLVASAELLDWQAAANPKPDQAALTAHLQGVDRALASIEPQPGQQRPDLLAANLAVVYTVPSATYTGARIGDLTAALVGRDANTMVSRPTAANNVVDRVVGALKQLAFPVGFEAAQLGVWASVAGQARSDAAFAGAWNAVIGTPLGVNAADNAARLAAELKRRNQADLPALMAMPMDTAEQKQKVRTAALAEADKITKRMGKQRVEMFGLLKTEADAHPPGKGMVVSSAQKALANKEADTRQQGIDADKSAGQSVAGFLDKWIGDKPAGHALAQFVGQVADIGTAVSTAIKAFKAIETVVSLATAAFTGNLLSAVGGLLGLFGGPTVEQQILAEIQQLRIDIANLGKQMQQNFDRIDHKLNKFYNDITEQLTTIANNIHDMSGHINSVAGKVTELASQLQSMTSTLLKAIGDLAQKDVWDAANSAIDYTANRTDGARLSDAAFDLAENKFQRSGTLDLMDGSFVVKPGNQGNFPTDDASVLANLESFGSEGAIRYLAHYAQQADYVPGRKLDPGMPVPAKAGNPTIWGAAANAYTLLANQNPDQAKKHAANRPGALLGFGYEMREAALRFSKPGPNGTVNQLFSSLLDNYSTRLNSMFSNVANYEENRLTTGRYRLFGDDRQPVPPHPGTEGPETMPPCNGRGDPISRPNNVLGTQLDPQIMFSLGVLPQDQRPTYRACWEALFQNDRATVQTKKCPTVYGGVTTPCLWDHHADLVLVARQYVRYPGSQEVHARMVQGTLKKSVYVTTCTNSNPDSNYGEFCRNQPTDPVALVNKDWPSYIRDYERGASSSTQNPPATAGQRNSAFLREQQKQYYRNARADIETGHQDQGRPLGGAPVNTAVQLLRSYTELGFPRALATDQDLRALLYGQYGILSNLPATFPGGTGGDGKPRVPAPLLQNIFGQAAINMDNNRYKLDTDQFDGQCPRPPGLDPRIQDDLIICMAADAQARVERLRTRFAEQFTNRWLGSDETLPSLQQQLRNLWLVTKAVHPGSDLGQPPGPPAPEAPAEVRWREPELVMTEKAGWGAPAVTAFAGGQIAVWRDYGEYKLAVSISRDGGATWSNPAKLDFGDVRLSNPSIVDNNGRLIIAATAFTGSTTKAVFATSADGVTWTHRDGPVDNVYSHVAPGLAVRDGRVHVALARTDDGITVFNGPNGLDWSPPAKELSGHRIGSAVALANYHGRLIAGWKNRDDFGMSRSFYDGNWSAPEKLLGDQGATAAGVGFTIAKGRLFAVWRGWKVDQRLFISASDDGMNWTPQHQIVRDGLSPDTPAAFQSGDRLRTLWTDEDGYVRTAVSANLP
ncbi:sialidase family protein [Crossiella cryophila]|uniref:Methyl-accepting chemotaxis protein n=1 Tax=Crossiella cryophila TaxID=43355 RepID=A0A7W7CCR6_9PSEU|nr:sialidase family protein [Crossiella cryophila]MBB4678762.1 methyl-accepting chemotaxis protein [Crossiella cryophila]